MRQILSNSLPMHAPEKLSPTVFFICTLARVALLADSRRAALGLDGRGRPSPHNADRCSGSQCFRL
jgi:hypothetical protein